MSRFVKIFLWVIFIFLSKNMDKVEGVEFDAPCKYEYKYKGTATMPKNVWDIVDKILDSNLSDKELREKKIACHGANRLEHIKNRHQIDLSEGKPRYGPEAQDEYGNYSTQAVIDFSSDFSGVRGNLDLSDVWMTCNITANSKNLIYLRIAIACKKGFYNVYVPSREDVGKLEKRTADSLCLQFVLGGDAMRIGTEIRGSDAIASAIEKLSTENILFSSVFFESWNTRLQ